MTLGQRAKDSFKNALKLITQIDRSRCTERLHGFERRCSLNRQLQRLLSSLRVVRFVAMKCCFDSLAVGRIVRKVPKNQMGIWHYQATDKAEQKNVWNYFVYDHLVLMEGGCKLPPFGKFCRDLAVALLRNFASAETVIEPFS